MLAATTYDVLIVHWLNDRPQKLTRYQVYYYNTLNDMYNQRTIGPENAHLKPDLGVLSHNEMTLTLNTHTPLLTS